MQISNALLALGFFLALLMSLAWTLSFTSIAIYLFLIGVVINCVGSMLMQIHLARGPSHKFDADLMATTKATTIGAKISNIIVTAALSVFWHTQYLVFLFPSALIGYFSGKDDVAVEGKEKSPTDILVLTNFIVPLNILALVQNLVASIILVWIWSTLISVKEFTLIPPLFAGGYVLLTLSFLLKSDLASNFSSSFIKPIFYYLVAMILVVVLGAITHIFLVAWSENAPTVSLTLEELFNAYKSILENGYLNVRELVLSAEDLAGFRQNLIDKFSMLSLVHFFDLVVLTLIFSAFGKNAVSAIRYRRGDYDRAMRATSFLRLNRWDLALNEWKNVDKPSDYPELHSHVLISSNDIDGLILLTTKEVSEKSLVSQYQFSANTKLYMLVSGYFVQNRVPLTRAYDVISSIYEKSKNEALSIAIWRQYSLTHEVAFGQIISLYPNDDLLSKVGRVFGRLDDTLDKPEMVVQIIDEELDDEPPSIYLTIALQLISTMPTVKVDRLLYHMHSLARELVLKFDKCTESIYSISGIEIAEWGSIARLVGAVPSSDRLGFFEVSECVRISEKLEAILAENDIKFPTHNQP